MSSIDTDEAARAFAVDPRRNVVLEASAGTGKTTVLVQRYVNLLKAGVEPGHILAITFTRKAATEMRERIIGELRAAASLSAIDRSRWLALRDRLPEIAISTIDAFCLSLLREFPLEADLDPAFDMADETEVPRFVEEALDRSMRIFNRLAHDEPDVALVIAQLGVSRTRAGLAALLERRLVAWGALNRFLDRGPRTLRSDTVCATAARDLLDVLKRAPGGLDHFLQYGPVGHPRFHLFVREVRRLAATTAATDAGIRAMLDRITLHFLTQDGSARKGTSIHPYNSSHYRSETAARQHRAAVLQMAPEVEQIARRFSRDLNAVLARGIRRMFAIALQQYRSTLDSRAVLDFSDVLEHALELLRRMDEFSQSRFRLESRYHHVLVDEFQDTSRAQWELVSLLIQSWGEGMGLASNPSIFIVGDRKQSIYRFRDAEVAVLKEAGRYIEGLRSGEPARRSISRSFRAVPDLLEFVNEVCGEMAAETSALGGTNAAPARFAYEETDRFPPVPAPADFRGPALGVAVRDTPEACAAAVAQEIERILGGESVRDRKSGVIRAATPGDIAILFRSRTSHREFERELELRGVPSYVYKGLGFFDSDEIKDVCALLRYLAQPTSELRTAAFLRSGFCRLSDEALAALAPSLSEAILGDPPLELGLDVQDAAVLAHLRAHVPAWLHLVDRLPPADLLEQLLPDLAYAYEIRGRRQAQAWENLKKMRSLIRRIQNHGYATLARIADHVDALSAGDESNAVLEAIDAVNLMTVHASKGLEFPIVFVVNMARGASGVPRPIRVIAPGDGEEPSVSVGPFVSDVDERERANELHESRRLLYVALTRARDRLYLSTALKDGAVAAGRGSLAEVLPPSVKELLTRAISSTEPLLTWASKSGRQFSWRVCPAAAASPPPPSEPVPDALPDRLDPLVAVGVTPRVAATDWPRARQSPTDGPWREASSGDFVGALVHRLLQRASRNQLPPNASVSELLEHARTLMTAEERASKPEVDGAIGRAVAIWVRLREREEIVQLLASDTLLAEVPFSMATGEGADRVIIRGVIDCLAFHAGRVTVVELKTGREQPSHHEQLELYIQAARQLFPGKVVDGQLIYQT